MLSGSSAESVAEDEIMRTLIILRNFIQGDCSTVFARSQSLSHFEHLNAESVTKDEITRTLIILRNFVQGCSFFSSSVFHFPSVSDTKMAA